MRKHDNAITEYPYVLETCDQVLYVPGKMIRSDNFYDSSLAYLSLSAYMVNMFKQKNSDDLIKSIPLYSITEIPKTIKGAPLCTLFKGYKEEISFCFENVNILNSILTAFKMLTDCRKGNPITQGNCNYKLLFNLPSIMLATF